jgi:small GTP-binding protein
MVERRIMKKVCLLGNAAVGKTSLIRRFVYDMFDDKYIVTFGAKVTTKQMEMKSGPDDINLTLIIWDILGQRVHDSLHAGHYKGAKGALIVCDLTRSDTVDDAEVWLEKLWGTVGEIPVILLGNKCDIPHGDTEEALKVLAEKKHLEYKTTSAKTGENVENAFSSISDLMLKGQ